MARINIEDKWWTDPRRYQLAERLKNLRLADGLMVEVWALAQRFWGNHRAKVPLIVFQQIPDFELLFECDLAIKHGGNVYVRGTKEFHEWYASLKESASKGGKSKGNQPKRIASERQADRKSPTPTPTPTLTLTLINKEEREETPHPLARVWKENKGALPDIKAWNKDRQKKSDQRWSEKPDFEYWTEVVKKLSASKFCTGGNDRGWRADFDFLLQPNTHVRAIEGRYDNNTKRDDYWDGFFEENK